MNNKQKEILRFIKSYIKNNGYSPTNDEIKEAVRINSKPVVNHYLNSLELLGKIKRDKYKHRNISICKPFPSAYLLNKLKRVIGELNNILEDFEDEIPNQE